MRIAVIGLGRIGSQLLRELAPHFPSIGLDIRMDAVSSIMDEGLQATTDYEEVAGLDVYLVAVSTGPRMENLLSAADLIRPAPGSLISVESTVLPGTMKRMSERFVGRGLIPGRDISLVHSPHRILFGDEESIFSQPRVIGGITDRCLENGLAFYRQLVPAIFPSDDIRLVELCKLVENSLRYMEISFAEALALYCYEAGLDFEDLRKLVNSKANVRLMRAEYGIGGECLPKDARFLHDVSGCKLLADAMDIDEEYRNWLFRHSRAPRVLVRGLTFKPGWRDIEHSRAVELVERLDRAGAEVFVEDPLYTADALRELGFKPWCPDQEIDTKIEWGRISGGGN